MKGILFLGGHVSLVVTVIFMAAISNFITLATAFSPSPTIFTTSTTTKTTTTTSIARTRRPLMRNNRKNYSHLQQQQQQNNNHHAANPISSTLTAPYSRRRLPMHRIPPSSLSSSADSSSSSISNSDDDDDSIATGTESNNTKRSINHKTKLSKFRKGISSYFKGNDEDDGLTFRQRLAKMGLATVLSYGWISNTNAMILIAAAWYVFSLKTKMSPLYPGQWTNFLGVYAGFYVISNFLRPIRVTIAIAIGPYFEKLVNYIQQKTKLPKAGAITATVLLVNLMGTILLMIGGISFASLLSGVPIFPPSS